VQLVSNLCAPDPPMSQTDGHTDGQSHYRALHYSASCGKILMLLCAGMEDSFILISHLYHCLMLVVCFEVYDFNGDGYISREEMFTCLKKSMVKQTTEEDPDEGTKDLVELALRKMVHYMVSITVQ